MAPGQDDSNASIIPAQAASNQDYQQTRSKT
jgi:hypothetical protein